MKLINEDFFDIQNKSELNEATHTRRWYISGVFAEQEIKNRNGRIYPKAVLESTISDYLTVISENKAIGELNHPEYPLPDPEKACHRIVEMKRDGNYWMGKSLVMRGTKIGDHVIALLENECQLGVSTRGVGSVRVNESSGIAYVQPDYKLNCVDIVLNPSAQSAFVNGIMEGKEWVWDHGVLVEHHAGLAQQEISKGSKADTKIVEKCISDLWEATKFSIESKPTKHIFTM